MLTANEPTDVSPPQEWDKAKLDNLKKTDLQAMAKELGLKGASKKSKSDLLQMLTEHHTGKQPADDEAGAVTSPDEEVDKPSSPAGEQPSAEEVDASEAPKKKAVRRKKKAEAEDEVEPEVVKEEAEEKVESEGKKAVRGRKKKTGVEEMPDVEKEVADAEIKTEDEEKKVEAADDVAMQPVEEEVAQPVVRPESRLNRSKSVAGGMSISNFLKQNNLDQLYTLLRKENLDDWTLLRAMTVADFKAIGVSAGMALRFILAMKQQFPDEEVATDTAPHVTVAIPVNNLQSLMDELGGKLGSLSLNESAVKSKPPTGRSVAPKKPAGKPKDVVQTDDAVKSEQTGKPPVVRKRPSRLDINKNGMPAAGAAPFTPGGSRPTFAFGSSAPVASRPTIAFGSPVPVKKPMRKTQPRGNPLAPKAAAAAETQKAEENVSADQKGNGVELKKKASVAGLKMGGVLPSAASPAVTRRMRSIKNLQAPMTPKSTVDPFKPKTVLSRTPAHPSASTTPQADENAASKA
ncbi:hypothetical protein HK104_008197 [Borealophlyctis nickersoniae]|nr:hypothetical protein HK104_008197 [Borealophlyctis nickersoniae]